MLLFKIIKVIFRYLMKSFLEIKWAISHVIIDHYIEKKLGIDTAGVCFVQKELSAYQDSEEYAPTKYPELQIMVDYLKLNKDDVFIDFGCGKGRVVFLVAMQKLKKVVGVEFNQTLIDIAKKNLKNLKLNNTPIELFQGDAVNFDVKDGTVFYMFNPFGLKTFAKVLDNIKKSMSSNPRIIRLLYRNSIYRSLLDETDWLEQQGYIDKTEIFVWRSKLN